MPGAPARPFAPERHLVLAAALLVLAFGGWALPWFSAEEPPTPITEPAAPTGIARIKLLDTELCQRDGGLCAHVTSSSFQDGGVAALPWAIFGGGVVYALGAALVDRRRVTHGEAPWPALGGTLGLGAIVVTLAIVYLRRFDVGPLEYEISERLRFGGTTTRAAGTIGAPALGLGGFVTILGVLAVAANAWRARPRPAPADAPTEAAALPRRAPLEAPPRGVETDPFRALPQPPPIRAVRPTTQAEIPRAAEAGDDTPGPTLLR